MINARIGVGISAWLISFKALSCPVAHDTRTRLASLEAQRLPRNIPEIRAAAVP